MKKTVILEIEKINPERAVLIEGLPGLGLVGKIASEYLIKQLKARKVAELYSPHFAHFVIVDDEGSLRLLRLEFYYWRGEDTDRDFILLTGDCQAQTVEGQYEVAGAIFNYAREKNVDLIITLGGYQREFVDEPQIFASATNKRLLEDVVKFGVKNSPPGSPIIGVAGILVGLSGFNDVDALCLLAETRGYRPDPKASKSLLNLLSKMFKFNIDLSDLESEIARYEKMEERIRMIERRGRATEEARRAEGTEKIFYIG
ncbi:MAG TPA: proteasome assembly chaperone family protein [Candidatus Bathyarchaeota archaeon]|nr:proteasome assembly chaperone family protein [Candidatus Bathyarchaeota archaeon]